MTPKRRVQIVVGLIALAAAAVAVAVAVVPANEGRQDPVAELRARVEARPDDSEARVQLGIALFEAGEREAAAEQWAEAERRTPDGAAALRAESLRHPEMAPGRPYFYPRAFPTLPSGQTGAEQLAGLRRRAEQGESGDWIAYGVALQRAGRPVSASRAFDQALSLSPDDLDAQVAAAVGRFDKDDPSAAFSRVGPLARDHPEEGVVRFHLGLMLLWLRQVDEARRQLEQAVAREPRSIYGKEARKLLERLEEVRT